MATALLHPTGNSIAYDVSYDVSLQNPPVLASPEAVRKHTRRPPLPTAKSDIKVVGSVTEHRNKYLQNPRTQPILLRFPGYENWMGVLRFVKQQQNVFVIYSVLLPSLIHVPFLQLPPAPNLSKIAAHLILC